MGHIEIFFNTEVENSPTQVLDYALAPVRYLCNGKTLSIQNLTVHEIESFHADGEAHVSSTDLNLHSSSKSLFRTVMAIIFLVPALFCALFKAISYLSPKVREDHLLVKQYFDAKEKSILREEPSSPDGSLDDDLEDADAFTALQLDDKKPAHLESNRGKTDSFDFKEEMPVDIVIGDQPSPIDPLVLGSLKSPLRCVAELEQHLLWEVAETERRPLVIYGKRLELKENPGFLELPTDKVVLHGVHVAKESLLWKTIFSPGSRWRLLQPKSGSLDLTNRVETALKRSSIIDGKPCQLIYEIPIDS